MDAVLSLSNLLIRTYLYYMGVLGLKMLAMSGLTGLQRFINMSFVNPEDAGAMRVKPKTSDKVERVRRAHLNDLENIVVFAFVSLAYIMTNPSVGWAILLFRVYTIARISHTLVYAVVAVPQPARAIAWFAGYFITIYMALQTITHFS